MFMHIIIDMIYIGFLIRNGGRFCHLLMHTPYTVWLWLANYFWRRRCFDIIDSDKDTRRVMGLLKTHLWASEPVAQVQAQVSQKYSTLDDLVTALDLGWRFMFVW